MHSTNLNKWAFAFSLLALLLSYLALHKVTSIPQESYLLKELSATSTEVQTPEGRQPIRSTTSDSQTMANTASEPQTNGFSRITRQMKSDREITNRRGEEVVNIGEVRAVDETYTDTDMPQEVINIGPDLTVNVD